MTTTRTPPFRADQVGSLLRPAHLIEAREKYRKRLIDHAELKAKWEKKLAAAVDASG